MGSTFVCAGMELGCVGGVASRMSQDPSARVVVKSVPELWLSPWFQEGDGEGQTAVSVHLRW